MSRWVRVALAFLFSSACVGVLDAGEQGLLPVARFAVGDRVRYRMHLSIETESSFKPEGQAEATDQSIRLAVDLTWQVEALGAEPSGGVTLRSLIEAFDLQSSLPGAGPLPEGFVGRAVTYRLLPDGRVDNIEAPSEWLENGQPPAWLRSWIEQSAGSAGGLPAHPVQPGENWSVEREFDVPGLPRHHLVSENEYLRDETVGETPCASVLTRFALSGADSREESFAGRARTRVERQVEGGGSRLSCYDLRTGRLLESTQRSRELVRLSVRQLSRKESESPPPMVVESRTTSESHLRVVD